MHGATFRNILDELAGMLSSIQLLYLIDRACNDRKKGTMGCIHKFMVLHIVEVSIYRTFQN